MPNQALMMFNEVEYHKAVFRKVLNRVEAR